MGPEGLRGTAHDAGADGTGADARGSTSADPFDVPDARHLHRPTRTPRASVTRPVPPSGPGGAASPRGTVQARVRQHGGTPVVEPDGWTPWLPPETHAAKPAPPPPGPRYPGATQASDKIVWRRVRPPEPEPDVFHAQPDPEPKAKPAPAPAPAPAQPTTTVVDALVAELRERIRALESDREKLRDANDRMQRQLHELERENAVQSSQIGALEERVADLLLREELARAETQQEREARERGAVALQMTSVALASVTGGLEQYRQLGALSRLFHRPPAAAALTGPIDEGVLDGDAA